MDKFIIFMENEFNKLETAYPMVMLEESMIKDDQSLSMFTESYNNIDYCIEASEKVDDKKKGIISRMVDWFKKLFAKMRDKIMELLGKKATEYEVYDKAPKIVQGMKGLLQKIKEAIRKFGDSKFADFLKFELIGTAVVVALTNIPRVEIWTMTTMKAVKADGLIKGLKSIIEDLQEDIGFISKKDNGDDGFSLLNFLKDLVSNLWKIIAWGFRPASNLSGYINKALTHDPYTGKFNM